MEIRNLAAVAKMFTHHKIEKIDPLGDGNINHTYLVDAGQEKFVLQRINTNVFSSPETLMRNLEKINLNLTTSRYPYIPVVPMPQNNGQFLWENDSGTWRALEYIGNFRSLEKASNPELVEISAVAFAELSLAMLNMDPYELEETIPEFHNPSKRFNDFLISVDKARDQTKTSAQGMIEHALALNMIVDQYDLTSRDLPVRLPHNDAKVGNILFDDTLSEVRAIIDFDTMMPGFLMNDFGDMARSMCNPVVEDSKDMKSVFFNERQFQYLVRGYLGVLKNQITNDEVESLIVGVKAIIYSQFIRFLTDYLSGNVYYHIEYPEHNLDRTRVQLKLLLDFLSKEKELAAIVYQEYNE